MSEGYSKVPHSNAPRPMPDVPQFVCQILLLAGAVFMLSQAGSWFVKNSPGVVNPVWPAAGFALAAALIYGLERAVPAVYLGALASSFLSGDSQLTIYVAPLGSVFETVVGFIAVRHWLKVDDLLPGLQDFVKFVIGGCLPGPAVFALVSAMVRSVDGRLAPGLLAESFIDTWQAHAFGTLVFGTFFLFALRRQDFRPLSVTGRLALLVCSVLLWAILALLLGSGISNPAAAMLLLGTALLLALLVSLLFGLRTAAFFQAMFVFLVPACVVIFRARANGWFLVPEVQDQHFLITGLAFFSSLGCLLMAAFRDELASLSIKFGLAMEAADLCAWEWTPAGWCCRASAWKEKFGLQADRVIPDASVRGLIHPADLEGFSSTFDSFAVSSESRWSHTYRMRDTRGHWVWVESHAQPVRWTSDDELAMVAGVTRDITEERNALQTRIETISTDAELRTLRSQLNPHFLFNALNSVRALIGRHDDSAKQMITSLGNLLRELLINRDGKLQSVERELKMVRDYLDVEAIRFGERLRFEIYCGPGVLSQRIPGMVVLTMVENAVKHGVSQLDEGGDIDISLRRDPLSGMLVVTVENDGKLTAPEPVGFGLTNCRRRIALVTEGLGSLDLREVPGPKVEAKLIYPWDERQLDTGAENRYTF